MEEKNIFLTFEKSETGLGGFPTGEKAWNTQVENLFERDKLNIIVFPDQIERITSSFTQGFFKELVKEIGFEGVEKHVKIKARTEKLAENVMADLFN